jgi:ATPase subunit of ABC transporter with duplicated ATPase domains
MSIVCTDLSFEWPDGTPVFDGLNATFSTGRTGLIGPNGAGKSTLLKLIAGRHQPRTGAIVTDGEVGYLPQDLALTTELTVADLLGIARALNAITMLEAGDASPEVFDAIGEDWDVAERARTQLDRLGLSHLDLTDRIARLSGGEIMLVALSAQFLHRPAILLLDEPTNNLDVHAKQRLAEAILTWPRVMVIVSHDRELLERVDQIAELRDGTLRTFGGNLSAYRAQLEAEQEAAAQAVSTAAATVRREHKDLVDAQVKQARRDRQGRAAADSMPKSLAGALKRKAQVTAGASRELHTQRLETAKARLADAESQLRDDPEIRIDLPRTRVPAGRTVLHLTGLDTTPWPPAGTPRDGLAELTVRGPERIALIGHNGAGKSTLLTTIATAGEHGLAGVSVRKATSGYLPQRLNVLDDERSIFENVRAAAPAASQNDVRQRLARFLFRGDRADQIAGSLSGGERFRAVLATLLLAEPAPQLLLLDEPTNSLDMASAAQLEQALSCYQGALIVASHDMPFLRSIGITRWWRLTHEDGLAED